MNGNGFLFSSCIFLYLLMAQRSSSGKMSAISVSEAFSPTPKAGGNPEAKYVFHVAGDAALITDPSPIVHATCGVSSMLGVGLGCDCRCLREPTRATCRRNSTGQTYGAASVTVCRLKLLCSCHWTTIFVQPGLCAHDSPTDIRSARLFPENCCDVSWNVGRNDTGQRCESQQNGTRRPRSTIRV